MAEFDLLIKGSRIVDGTCKPGFDGDLAIRGEKVVAVGEVRGDAVREIDGSGLVAAPGFVDTHSHADVSIMQYPLAENFVMQGITMFLGGNCGSSPAPLTKIFDSSISFPYAWWNEVEPNKTIPRFLSLDALDRYGDLIRERLGFGIDWRTFGEFLLRLEARGISINYAPLVGHTTIRIAVMGEDHLREATQGEIAEMKTLVEDAMRSGAFGISSFFDTVSPTEGAGEYAAIGEMIELAKVAKRFGGLYSPHKRHHRSNWYTLDLEECGYGIAHAPPGEVICGRYHGLLEVIEVSRHAEIPLLMAHLAPAYYIPQPAPVYLQDAAGKATIEIIDKARGEGLKIFHNAIAHSASIHSPKRIVDCFTGTFAQTLARPEWLQEMTKEEFVEGLKMKEFRDKVKGFIYTGRFKFGMFHPLLDPYWTDTYRIVRCRNREYEGRTIGEIARKRCPDHIIQAQYEESYNTLFDILVEDPDTIWVEIMDKREYQEALRVFFKHSVGMPCTDCGALPSALPEGMSASRVAYGMFPYYIDKFVKEEGVLSLEEAIYRLTYLPAHEVLGLTDRGVLSPGAYADIVLFDFKKIRMAGTYMEPAIPPEGIENVIVNGKIVYEQKNHTGIKPGKVIRHR